MATNPGGLDKLIGTASAADSVAGKLSKALGAWTKGATGQLVQRQANATKLQASLDARQAKLDSQYNSAYQRYLGQYTKLQTLQSQMTSTSSIFTSMFSSSGG